MVSVPDAAGAPDQNVTRLTLGDREILLVGTAHVSRGSIDDVRRVIAETRPDSVCVELDERRYEMLLDEARWERLDVVDVLKQGRAGIFLSSLLFAGFQKRLGDQLGVRPGAEMLAAIEAAREIGAKVVLGDREIQATLTRCHGALGPVGRVKVGALLMILPFATFDLDEKQVEELKSKEGMRDAMQAFAEQLPTLKVPLIDERDRYLASSIASAEGRRVVAVVGAAHAAGIARHIGETIDRDALVATPERTPLDRGIPWLLPTAVLCVLGAAASSGGPVAAGQVALGIALPAALATAAVALAAGGAFLTSLSASLLAAPSLFVPWFAFGAAVGRLQARLAPPSADEKARLRSDVLAPRLGRRNRALVPIALAVLVPVARTLGVTAGLAWAIVGLFA